MTENPERRHSQRNRPEQLVYADLGPDNGGMILNVSEEGFSFRSVRPLQPNVKIHFAFAIDPARRLEGTGELEWTKENGRVGGLQFTDVSEEFRKEIRRWLRESQPSVGAGREFIPAAAAHADTLEKPHLDLKAESPKAQPAAPLVEKLDLLATAEEVQEGSLPRLSRAAAVGIVAAGMAVALAAAVFSFRREVGESLIRLGEKMVGETKPAERERRATPKILSVTPAMNPSANSPSGSPAAEARVNPVPAEAPSMQKAPSTPAGSSKVAALGTAREEPGQAELVVAQRILGSKNGSRDITGAMKLLWVAVQKGNSAAVLTLSDLYLRGQVVAKNCAQARVLLMVAANKGSAEAKARLEQLSEQGCP